MTNRNRRPLLFGFPSTWTNKRNVSPFGYPFNVCQLHARCRYNFSGFLFSVQNLRAGCWMKKQKKKKLFYMTVLLCEHENVFKYYDGISTAYGQDLWNKCVNKHKHKRTNKTY